MKEQIFQVDAFTNKPFAGNPAGVVLLASEKSDDWMRSFAREMNLSETAFLMKDGDGYHLRWFTAKVEVSLCGHATLASAHVLFNETMVPGNETILFSSASGVLNARFERGWIELDFPAFEVKPVSSTSQIDQAIGFSPKKIFESDVNLLVEMDSFDAEIIVSQLTGHAKFGKTSTQIATKLGIEPMEVAFLLQHAISQLMDKINNKKEAPT